MRKIPKKQKTKIKFPCDVCNEKEYLVAHHILGRKILNPNYPSNICNVCPNCHYKIHLGEIVIEKWLLTTTGYELFWHKKNDESFSDDDSTPHIIN